MSDARPRYRSVVFDSSRWEGFHLRSGDIVISTPPKCGTTWMQMICALLIFQDPILDRPLTEISPWLDMCIRSRDDVFSLFDAQRHRRFIKTHTPLDGLPLDDRVTYLCVGRDPRDVAISIYNHFTNMNADVFFAARAKAIGMDDIEELNALDPPGAPGTLEESFWRWIDSPTQPVHSSSSLLSTLHHYDLALNACGRDNIVVFHYGDLKEDLEGEMRRLADRLGIVVADSVWPRLVEAATFNRMRSRASDLAPETTQGLWKENQKFFHSGTGGIWRELFDDGDQRRYDARVAELAHPDVAAWAHNGWRGAAKSD